MAAELEAAGHVTSSGTRYGPAAMARMNGTPPPSRAHAHARWEFRRAPDKEEVDRMLEQAKEATRYGKYTSVEYARFA
jgi:hypothetical protein